MILAPDFKENVLVIAISVLFIGWFEMLGSI